VWALTTRKFYETVTDRKDATSRISNAKLDRIKAAEAERNFMAEIGYPRGKYMHKDMRKEVLGPTPLSVALLSSEAWLDLEQVAQVQVTSEHPDFPVQCAFRFGSSDGWRAGNTGEQTIRLIFDRPQRVNRIWLRFNEAVIERTQEFTLRWSADQKQRGIEIVRQQWNFSPEGSSTEIEDYTVNLQGVLLLELTIIPDVGGGQAVATLADWCIG
jgi:hypothetical protein